MDFDNFKSQYLDIHKNLNRITNLNNYTLNVYSSISNSNYNKFVFDTFNNPIPYRNRAITISSNHYFYNNYMGVKYIIAKNNISSDYELIKSNGKLNLYLNKNAYKIGYVTNNVISSSDYKLLDYPYTMEAIYKGVVVDDNTTFNDYKIKEYKLDIKSIEYNNLNEKGFNSIQDTTPHDYGTYTSAYAKSRITLQNAISSYGGFGLAIDVHRDAIENLDFRPTVNIRGVEVARIMLVIGAGSRDNKNPYFEDNLKLALKLQYIGEKIYPGLFRTMYIRNSIYNQDLNKYLI